MRAWRELSPMQLGRWIGVGYILLLCPIAAPSWVAKSLPRSTGFWALLLCTCVAFGVVIIASVSLKRGLDEQLWHELEVDRLRRFLESRWLVYSVWIPAPIFFVRLLASPRPLDAAVLSQIYLVALGNYWPLRLWLMESKKPPESTESSYKPLSSDHRGQREN